MNRDNCVIFMSVSDVIKLHDMAIERFGGASGLRDSGLLESAIHQPLMMIDFGEAADREVYQLGAAYFYHIIKNHPFIDGNKRAGLLAAIEFFHRNGFGIIIESDILYQIALDTAASRLTKQGLAMLFRQGIKLL